MEQVSKLSRIRILLVGMARKDERALRTALKVDGLKSRISTCQGIDDALERLKRAPIFHAVIAEEELPTSSGLELFKKMKSLMEHPPLLLLVEAKREKRVKAAHAAGVDQILIKDPDGAYFRLLPSMLLKMIRSNQERLAEKKHAADLSEGLTRYRTLFEVAGDAIFLLDFDRFSDCNPQTLSMFGCTRDEIINRTPYDFSPPNQPDGRSSKAKAIEKITHALEGSPQRFEWVHTRLDGVPFITEVTLTPLQLGEEPYLLAVLRDITERMQIDEQLNTLSMAVEQISNSVAILDLDGFVQYANPKLCELYGISAKDIAGTNWRTFLSAHSDLREMFPDIQTAVLGRGEVWKGEITDKGEDGVVVWREATVFPIKDDQGEISHAVYISEDITERKLAEQSLRYSIELEQLVAKISTRLHSIKRDTLDSEIELALGDLGRFLHATRCNLFLYTTDDGQLGLTHDWCAEGVKSFKGILADIQEEHFPWSLRKVMGGDVLHVPDVELLPKEAEAEKTFLLAQGVRSFIYLPMPFEGEMIGSIGINYDPEREDMHEGAILLLGTLGEIIADAIVRRRSEEKLRESEARKALVLQTLPMAFYTAYPRDDFSRVWVSEQIERVSGFAPEQFLSNTGLWAERLHPQDRDRVLAAFGNLLEVGAIEVIYRWQAQDGQYRWFHDHGVLVRHEDNSPSEIIGTWLDITERVHMESDLQESERRYRNIIQTSPMGMHIYELDDKDRLVFAGANPAADEILGLDNSQFIGKFIEEAFPPLADTEVPDRYRRAAVDGESWYTEQIEYQDEKIAGAFEVYAFQTSPRVMTAMFIDITERKIAEKTLEQQAERLHMLREVDKAILEAETAEDIAQGVLSRVRKLIPCQRASVALFEFGHELTMRIVAAVPASEQFPIGREFKLPDPSFQDLETLKSRKIAHVEDLQALSQISPMQKKMAEEGIRSFVNVPLILQEELIGSLNLGASEANFFTSEHIEIAREVADLLAISIHQARLLEEEQRRRRELEALEKVSIALRRADKQQEMLPIILEVLVASFNADAGAIFTPPGEPDHTVVKGPHQHIALMPEDEEVFFREVAEIMNSDQPKCITETPFQIDGVKSIVIVPLRPSLTPDRAVVLYYIQRRDFSENEQRLLKTIAEVSVIALGRIAVHESLERQVIDRTREITTLYELAEISASNEDPQTTLAQSLDKTLSAVNSEAGTIHLMGRDKTKLVMVVQSGLTPAMERELKVVSLEESFWRSIVEKGEPLLQLDLQNGVETPSAIQHSKLSSFICAPIMAQDETLGIISVFHTTNHDPTLDEIGLLSLVSDQIGLAVERTRLRDQARHSALIHERQRLARELHDAVTQSLYSLSFISKASRNFAKLGQWEKVEEHLLTVQETAQQALKEMRLLVYELMPTSLEEQGLVDVLHQRLQFVERRSGVETEVETQGNFDLPARVQVGMYRIAQEALNNTLKHAAATKVVVRLLERDTKVTMTIEDNGVGFDTSRTAGGMGLANMHARAENLGGDLSIESELGRGTKVRMVIPKVIP